MEKITELQTTFKKLFASGLTQRQVAEHIGLAQSTVAELSSGRLKSVRYDVGTKLVALCIVHKIN